MRLAIRFRAALALGLLAAAAQDAAAQGDGLTGTYYNYTGAEPPAYPPGNPYGNAPNAISAGPVTRLDPAVDFFWDQAAPIANIAADDFYAVWTGYLLTTAAGAYQFWEETDDGGHFYIRPIGGAWNQAATFTSWAGEGMTIRQIPFGGANQITLLGNHYYEIRFEMYDSGGGAGARLRWQPPGGAQAVIPQSQLYSTVTLPPPPVLNGAAIINGADLDWADIAAATAGYEIFIGPANNGPWTSIYTGTTSAHVENGLAYPGTYWFYGVSITTTGLVSNPGTPISVTVLAPPPRANSHSEGLLDDNCACGSSIPGPLLPGLAGVAGLAILAAARRRKERGASRRRTIGAR